MSGRTGDCSGTRWGEGATLAQGNAQAQSTPGGGRREGGVERGSGVREGSVGVGCACGRRGGGSLNEGMQCCMHDQDTKDSPQEALPRQAIKARQPAPHCWSAPHYWCSARLPAPSLSRRRVLLAGAAGAAGAAAAVGRGGVHPGALPHACANGGQARQRQRRLLLPSGCCRSSWAGRRGGAARHCRGGVHRGRLQPAVVGCLQVAQAACTQGRSRIEGIHSQA